MELESMPGKGSATASALLPTLESTPAYVCFYLLFTFVTLFNFFFLAVLCSCFYQVFNICPHTLDTALSSTRLFLQH